MRGGLPVPVRHGLASRWLFRMWYVGTRNSSKPRVCYAESHDGLTWEKPQLGICEYDGSKQNNIVIQPEYPNGFLDDCSMIYEPDDEWPYKLLYWDSMDASPLNWGIFATRSKDGIHFESIGKVLPKWGDRFIAVTKKVDGKYGSMDEAPSKPVWTNSETGKGASDTLPSTLSIHSRESDPSSTPRARTCTTGRPGSRSSSPIPRSVSDAVLLAVTISVRGNMAGRPAAHARRPDVLDPELVWSYDGRNWSRSHERKPFIPLGRKGAFDSVWLNLATNAPILNYNQLWFYYSGRAGGHGAQFPGAYGAIGLATLRVGRVLLALFRPHRRKRIRRRTHQADFVGRRRSPPERRSAARHHRTSHQRHHCRRQGVRRDTGRCEPADRGLPVRRLQSDRRQHAELRGGLQLDCSRQGRVGGLGGDVGRRAIGTTTRGTADSSLLRDRGRAPLLFPSEPSVVRV